MATQNHKGHKLSPFRRDKERVSRRFQMNLEAIISKYDHPFADSDVLDLSDMTIVEDRGFLKRTETVEIGKTKLATEKASFQRLPGFDWNSTKDSTDSAFGSTHCSGTDDASGTDYSYQTQRFTDIKEEHAEYKHEDDWMGCSSHSDDSGNEDTDSDVSGPSTPHKSLLYTPVHRQRTHDAGHGTACLKTKGNLSQRCRVEDGRKGAHGTKKREAWIGVQSLEDEDIDDEDEDGPYYFKEELPSILEEKKRFVSKFIDSSIDGDNVDEMNSQTEDEASTGTVESSETSGFLSAWSTLKTTPKRASKTQLNDSHADVVNDLISRVPGRDLVFSCDSDCTDSSTILAGNLNGREVVCPSKVLRDPHPKTDTDGEILSQPPFKAICNSTMLSEFNPSDAGFAENSKSTDVKLPMARELLIDGEGEMYLGEVPQNDQTGLKQDTPVTKKNKAHTTFIRSTAKPQKCEDRSRDVQNAHMVLKKPCTVSAKKFIQGESSESSLSITPKAQSRIRHASRQLQTSFSYPHFNTDEIIENFKSPKPLVIPGFDLKDLDLTPRRKCRQRTPAKSSESLRNALLRLQSPQAHLRTGDIGSRKAMEIRPCNNNSDHEMTLVVEDQHLLDARPKETSSWSDYGVHLRGTQRNLTENTQDQNLLDHDESIQNFHGVTPELYKVLEHGAMENGKSGTASSLGNVGQIPSKAAQRVHTPYVSREHPQPTCEEQTPTKVKENTRRRCRLVPQVKLTEDCPTVQKSRSCEEILKQPVKVSLCLSAKACRGQEMSNMSPSSGLKEKLPRSKQSASKNKEATVKAVVQHLRNSRQTSQEDAFENPRHETETPVLSKPQRATKYPPTPFVGKSPSTLSSPLTRMTLASPQNPEKVLENRRSSKFDSMEEDVTTPVKWSTKPKPREKDTRRSKGDKMKLDRTHMTILASDDSSVEEMEVDPYSLTADDSSPSPKLHQLQPNPLSSSTNKSMRKSSTKQFKSPCPRKRVQSQSKDVAGDQKMLLRNMASKRDSEGRNHLTKDEPSYASRPSNSLGPVASNVISRHLDDNANSMKRPNSRNRDRTGTLQHVIDASLTNLRSAPGHDDYTALTKHKQSKNAPEISSRLRVRRDHSQYFSEDEYNSSGDDAKFLISVPHRSRHEDESFDETYSDLSMSPKHRKFYVSEKTGALMHKTTIKCGRIISSPKSSRRSPSDIRKTRSSTLSNAAKAKRAILNSPAKTPNRATSHTQANRRFGQNLFLSPSRCPSEFSSDEPLQLSISSPLRINGCNVIGSYSCKGPGNCNKPFCFSCAVAEAR